jgi:predicted lipid-binding transport protein (Tim44 family)
MQELIARIADVTGVDKAKAETGLGIILSLIRNHGTPEKVTALFEKLPGAEAFAARHAKAKAGGLLGKLGGGLMGGPLVAVSQLQTAGFSMAQIRSLGSEVLSYAREKAGDRLVRETAGSIPGLSGYL